MCRAKADGDKRSRSNWSDADLKDPDDSLQVVTHQEVRSWQWHGFSIFNTWNLKHPFISGCFNWMIPILYIGNGCFTKHPFKNCCFGHQVCFGWSFVSSLGKIKTFDNYYQLLCWGEWWHFRTFEKNHRIYNFTNICLLTPLGKLTPLTHIVHLFCWIPKPYKCMEAMAERSKETEGSPIVNPIPKSYWVASDLVKL